MARFHSPSMLAVFVLASGCATSGFVDLGPPPLDSRPIEPPWFNPPSPERTGPELGEEQIPERVRAAQPQLPPMPALVMQHEAPPSLTWDAIDCDWLELPAVVITPTILSEHLDQP